MWDAWPINDVWAFNATYPELAAFFLCTLGTPQHENLCNKSQVGLWRGFFSRLSALSEPCRCIACKVCSRSDSHCTADLKEVKPKANLDMTPMANTFRDPIEESRYAFTTFYIL